MNTYEYEVAFKKDGWPDYFRVRAKDKIDAIQKINRRFGDITVISVSRIGN